MEGGRGIVGPVGQVLCRVLVARCCVGSWWSGVVSGPVGQVLCRVVARCFVRCPGGDLERLSGADRQPHLPGAHCPESLQTGQLTRL